MVAGTNVKQATMSDSEYTCPDCDEIYQSHKAAMLCRCENFDRGRE